jgi:hypothetical protein
MSKRQLCTSPDAKAKRSKAKYLCKFQEQWIKDFDFINKSVKSDNHAFCTYCRVDFSVGAGGRNDINRHTEAKKHKDHVKALAKVTKMNQFIAIGNDQVDQVIPFFLS